MFMLFMLILVVGSLPIRLSTFKTNNMILALAKAFSGGLFLAVGIVHLLPEASQNFENYFKQKGEVGEHFPWAFLILLLSFSIVLFIEKIATDHHNTHNHLQETELYQTINSNNNNRNRNRSRSSNISQLFNKRNSLADNSALLIDKNDIENEEQQDEQVFKSIIRTQSKVAQKTRMSIENQQTHDHQYEKTDIGPYLLQVAVGIHAVFEGLSIGLATQVNDVITLSLAVICHKWAEGLTLGLAFAESNIPTETSQIMIIIQAIMNPVGIGIGWILSGQNELVTGIFTSISAGTFLYIATVEVITEEFSIARYKVKKFILFMLAILFVSLLYLLEQFTEP